MLTPFFYALRAQNIPVSLTEWMAFMQALSLGLHHSDLNGFYALARALLVKDVARYDAFDQVFAHHFRGAAAPPALRDEIEGWLADPAVLPWLSEEELRALERLDPDRLRQEFERRLREQRERHDGGNQWIGTGGTSPFGHSGRNPEGVRVGGEGGGRSAIQVASERRFRNYRDDLVLDTRQMQVALKKLRAFERTGRADQLDLPQTIDRTCRNAGELELVFRPPRRNQVRLLLLMDAGGSMEPHARLVSRLFSAAARLRHFRLFRHYYFHNAIYETLFDDIHLDRRTPTARLLHELDSDWRLIVVGDASMAPYELTHPGGAIYYYHRNQTPGIVWLRRIATHFRKAVWLNPLPEQHWWSHTIGMIRDVFPMQPLTLHGLERAVAGLL